MSRIAVYIAWGDRHVREAVASWRSLSQFHPETRAIVISDKESQWPRLERVQLRRVDFELPGLLRKAELWDHVLPEPSDTYLFLDTDTRVLGKVDLGFEASRRFGMALAPAPLYDLESFLDFRTVMGRSGADPKGQLQYNSGVIFFTAARPVQSVMTRWRTLVEESLELSNDVSRVIETGDQPFLSLACELEGMNPYVLSPNFNQRGAGNRASGEIRIWHNHDPPPRDINKGATAWPGRRITPWGVQRHRPVTEFFLGVGQRLKGRTGS